MHFARVFLACSLCCAAQFTSAQSTDLTTAGWQTSFDKLVKIVDEGPQSWKVVSTTADEVTIESREALACRPGDTFAVNVKIRVDINTKALPELACYDAAGKEIVTPSSLVTGPRYITTNRQELRRVFPTQPGTATVRARIRATGKGTIELSDLEFRPQPVDPYATGALIAQVHASRRSGVVIESNFGIVNADTISKQDRDGDGKWAKVSVDLDKLTDPAEKGVDWRSNFEGNANEILWSEGVVLKSDSVREDRQPSKDRALHFRFQGRRGPFRAWLSDPGRIVAWSRDGLAWFRGSPGQEIDLGVFPAADGLVEFWLDACYRDPVSAGPVYFDYVRLLPVDAPESVERLFQAARWKAQPPERGSVDERLVPITVNAPAFAQGERWPVRCGLPIPQSELASAANVEVRNADGKVIPSQCRVMARWPDGSAKWIFLDYFHDLRVPGQAVYNVAYGNRVRAAQPAAGVKITPSNDGVAVDTGAIRFTVPKNRFGMIEDVSSADGEVLQREPLDLEIVESAGQVWRALDLPVVKLEVEHAGPLHAVILAETRLAESGKPSAGFFHRVRIHAYAGSPLIEVDYFVANTDNRPAKNVEGSMASKVVVKSVSLKIKPQQPIQQAHQAGGPSTVPGAVVQPAADKFVVQSVGDSREQPGRAAGSVSLSLADNHTLSLGVAEFAEQFPKALRWTKDAVEIDLWAEEGDDFDWIEGVGKTHHLSLCYSVGAPVDASLLVRTPVLALADPRWYCQSGAMGPLMPAAASSLPVVERTLAQHMDDVVVDQVGRGFENYGDHSSGGYVKGTFLWDNNEYDLPAGCLVHFARTGDRGALDVGLASALHYLDVDMIHYSSQHADWARAQHVHSHGTFGHHTAQGPDMHHAGYVQGLIWYSYLTGDPVGIEGSQGIADWILRNAKIQVEQMERGLGHPLTTLNDVYEATGEEQYLKGAARYVDQAQKWEHPLRSGYLASITESPAYYSGSSFCGGLLPSAILKFNSWARDPEIDAMLDRVARWTLTDVWRPPANIFTKGGSPRRGGDGQQIASHLRLMDDVFARTGDPLYLVAPRECIVRGFGENARSIGTRSTGLVFNNVPWFIAAIQKYGDPQPDAQLEVTAPKQEIASLGQKFRVRVRLKNAGPEPLTDFRASFQSRVDFQTRELAPPPTSLSPGQTAELTYEVTSPTHANPQCLYNRVAYAHFTALYRRSQQAQYAHVPVAITLQEE